MRLILIRHGDAHAGFGGVIGGRTGCTGLTDLGRRQAEALGRYLETSGRVQADVLLVSEIPRAIETAQIIGPGLGLEVSAQEYDLCEVDTGEADGLAWEEYTKRYGSFDMQAEPDRVFAPEGDSWNSFHERVHGLVQRLAVDHPDATVVAVCHAGVIVAALRCLLGTPHGSRSTAPARRPSAASWQRGLPRSEAWAVVSFEDPDERDRYLASTAIPLRQPATVDGPTVTEYGHCHEFGGLKLRAPDLPGGVVARIPWIVSPDDHIQEPPHLWQSRLPASLRDRGPRVERLKGHVALNAGDLAFVEADDGQVGDVWNFDGRLVPILRIAAAIGVPRAEVDARPVTFDDLLAGCFDPAARLADMDRAGIAASVCYPNMFVRFCGQTFSLHPDKELALACIRAYNDFVVEEWCAGSGGRLVPMGIVPLWDVELAVTEARRLARLGFRTITFSEAPHLLGLPSIHSGAWDPLFDVCAQEQLVVSLHIGTGGFPMLAADAPAAVPNVMASFNAGYTLTDLLFSGVFARMPDLKVCLAESQLGWIPYVLARADFVWEEMSGEGFTGIDKGAMPEPPSAYFARNVWVTFFRDPLGLELIDRLGVDRVLYETDYPHTDTSWPDCLAVADEATAALRAEDAARIVAGNAMELFRVELD